jgi:AcrR family transcriptional regulator
MIWRRVAVTIGTCMVTDVYALLHRETVEHSVVQLDEVRQHARAVPWAAGSSRVASLPSVVSTGYTDRSSVPAHATLLRWNVNGEVDAPAGAVGAIAGECMEVWLGRVESRRMSHSLTQSGSPLERILDSSYELFSRHGVRAVGVDAIVAQAGVAKMTLYRYFASKDELVLAFMERREQRWTQAWVQAETMQRASTPEGRLLAIFDLFDEWFHRDDFEGCSFMNVLLEIDDRKHPVHRAAVRHLSNIRAFLKKLAEEAGVRDPDGFSRRWHILMKGSIVAAGEGDRGAARAARDIGRQLLDAEGITAAVPQRGRSRTKQPAAQ